MRHYYNPSNYRQYKPKRGLRQRFFGLFKGGSKRRVIQYSLPPAARVYSNPWKKVRGNWRAKATAWFLGALVVLWLGLMVYLPYFRINSVTFEGLKIIKQEEINKFVWDNYLTGSKLIPANNYFLVSAGQIKNGLLKQYSLNGVEVKKVFPGQLNIIIEEKISSIIYDNGQSYYLLDKEGSVVKYLSQVGVSEYKAATPTEMPPTTPTSTVTSTRVFSISISTTSTPLEHLPDFKRIKKNFGAFPLVFDLREPQLNDKQTEVLPASLINSAIDWYGALEKRGIAGVKYFTLDQPSAGLTIYTNLPWKLYINPSGDLENQIANLKIILRDNNPREYVDMRYGERVFWK